MGKGSGVLRESRPWRPGTPQEKEEYPTTSHVVGQYLGKPSAAIGATTSGEDEAGIDMSVGVLHVSSRLYDPGTGGESGCSERYSPYGHVSVYGAARGAPGHPRGALRDRLARARGGGGQWSRRHAGDRVRKGIRGKTDA